ncbi:DUF2156 domain-containing protein [Helicobacter aurati]|uniref:DUF2156 domain-containing protein n=2 Tax=Helicobacter aurati TaxID=137778 RepID=A0A3D8J7B6_9HELI|nr:DUF2156 domain-containing protein [Helicobacter aurati]
MQPSEISFKEITLCDKEIISTYLRQDPFMISDVSFGNLFLWRLARKIEFAIIHECLVIKTTYPDKNPFVFFPIGAGDKHLCLQALKHYCDFLAIPLEFHSIEQKNIAILRDVFGDIQPVFNRDRSDYIYLTKNLISLSGRKYHKKKNHLNRFFEEYKGFSFEEIDSNNLLELQTTWNLWSQNYTDEGLINEAEGIRSALQNYGQLDFKGGLLRFDSTIIAFSFGEIISDTFCVIHIEKADINYRGAYQAINQQLLQHCFAHVTYVNREEDLGIEGLRKAKMSYNPESILEKYEVIITT